MESFGSLIEKYNNNTHTLSFVVMGDPFVQKRAKMTYRNTKLPIYYDPSNDDKRKWRTSFHTFLSEGNINLPVFGSDPLHNHGISLVIDFFISRPAVDYCIQKGEKKMKVSPHLFPNIKDLDNMVKFYMDAMQEVAYNNDNVICQITCSKHFTDEIKSCFPTPYVIIKLEQPVSNNCY
jgi:Holliday junction resolvase RusA-like endonuclease